VNIPASKKLTDVENQMIGYINGEPQRHVRFAIYRYIALNYSKQVKNENLIDHLCRQKSVGHDVCDYPNPKKPDICDDLTEGHFAGIQVTYPDKTVVKLDAWAYGHTFLDHFLMVFGLPKPPARDPHKVIVKGIGKKKALSTVWSNVKALLEKVFRR